MDAVLNRWTQSAETTRILVPYSKDVTVVTRSLLPCARYAVNLFVIVIIQRLLELNVLQSAKVVQYVT